MITTENSTEILFKGRQTPKHMSIPMTKLVPYWFHVVFIIYNYVFVKHGSIVVLFLWILPLNVNG